MQATLEKHDIPDRFRLAFQRLLATGKITNEAFRMRLRIPNYQACLAELQGDDFNELDPLMDWSDYE
jgi:hypothetical protein